MDDTGSFLDSFKSLTDTGVGIYKAFTGTPAAATGAVAPAAASSSLTKYLPWGIGAVVLLIVLAMFVRK